MGEWVALSAKHIDFPDLTFMQTDKSVIRLKMIKQYSPTLKETCCLIQGISYCFGHFNEILASFMPKP